MTVLGPGTLVVPQTSSIAWDETRHSAVRGSLIYVGFDDVSFRNCRTHVVRHDRIALVIASDVIFGEESILVSVDHMVGWSAASAWNLVEKGETTS